MCKLRLSTSVIAFLSVLASGRTSTATNICDETVPSNRMVDGFPAYAQCAAASGSAIYSNNGIDTATSSGGTGWVRTQGSGGYQCTEWAHRYLYFRWNVQSVPSGNAGVWCDGTIPSGLEKTATPMHGDLIVFAPRSCGADPTTGHVAVIDVVDSTTVTFVEQNGANRRSCAISTAACFLHATANDGTSFDGGAFDGGVPDAAVGNDGNLGREVSADSRRADATGGGGIAGTGGALATGGAVGTGGVLAAGGANGSGGVVGGGGANGGVASSGGTIGTGAASGSGGLATTAVSGLGSGGVTGPTGPSDVASNGCACRLADHRSARQVADGWAGLALLLAALVVFPRRARPRKK
jgi:surface antigen